MHKNAYCKGLFLLASLPLTLSLTGASAATRHLAYKVTPIFLGKKLTITWNWHDDEGADFLFSYAFVSNGNLMDSGTDAHSFETGSPDYSNTVTIPAAYVKGDGTILLQVDYGSYYHSSTKVEIPYTAGSALEETVEEDCAFQPKRTYISNGYGEGAVKVCQDYFQFRNAAMTRVTSGIRSVGIENYRIGYSNLVSPDIEWYGGALWCVGHLEDFPAATLRYNSNLKKMCRYFSLNVEKLADYQGDAGFTYYGLSLKTPLAYGRIHLNGMSLNKATGLYFESDRLLVPVGYGHDFEEYEFWIELRGKTTGDLFRLHRKVRFDDLHFGSCENADYCVVEG